MPFLLTCRSEEFFSKNQLGNNDTLKIINAYLEKHYLPPRENASCYRSSDFILVNDTLVWNNYMNSEVLKVLSDNKIQISKEPIILSMTFSKFPDFIQKRVELVNRNDDEEDDWCGIYTFSPAYKTKNENEYIIHISFDSYEMDFESTELIEFSNNNFRVIENLEGQMTFF